MWDSLQGVSKGHGGEDLKVFLQRGKPKRGGPVEDLAHPWQGSLGSMEAYSYDRSESKSLEKRTLLTNLFYRVYSLDETSQADK